MTAALDLAHIDPRRRHALLQFARPPLAWVDASWWPTALAPGIGAGTLGRQARQWCERWLRERVAAAPALDSLRGGIVGLALLPLGAIDMVAVLVGLATVRDRLRRVIAGARSLALRERLGPVRFALALKLPSLASANVAPATEEDIHLDYARTRGLALLLAAARLQGERVVARFELRCQADAAAAPRQTLNAAEAAALDDYLVRHLAPEILPKCDWGVLIATDSARLVSGQRVLSPTAAQTIDDAAQLIAAAECTAREVVERGQAQAAQALQQARSDGLAQGAQDHAEKLAELEARYAARLGAMHQQIGQLALNALERLLGDIDSREWYTRALDKTAHLLREATYVTLRTDPDSVAEAEAAVQALAQTGTVPRFVRVVADARLTSRGCVLESDCGRVDASLHTQLRAIRLALEKQFGPLVDSARAATMPSATPSATPIPARPLVPPTPHLQP